MKWEISYSYKLIKTFKGYPDYALGIYFENGHNQQYHLWNGSGGLYLLDSWGSSVPAPIEITRETLLKDPRYRLRVLLNTDHLHQTN